MGDVVVNEQGEVISYGASSHDSRCGCRRCVGFTVGNSDAVTHGAHSERVVRPLATVQKRRFLRQNGLRKADVDGIGLALLDAWARAQAKVELLDLWYADHGVLDSEGKPQPSLAIYFTALAAATKTLARLHDHLRQRAEVDPFEALSAHVIEMRKRDG
jgi:hypothetical protein